MTCGEILLSHPPLPSFPRPLRAGLTMDPLRVPRNESLSSVATASVNGQPVSISVNWDMTSLLFIAYYERNLILNYPWGVECNSLPPFQSMSIRVSVWGNVSGNDIRFVYLDFALEHDRLLELISREKPDAVIHFAEQRSAPYSLKGACQNRYTVDKITILVHKIF